jgi:hypothetical protein
MLYQTRKTSTARRLAAGLLGLLASAFAALPKRFADTEYLEGLRESELEDLGLRRTPERDYRPFV